MNGEGKIRNTNVQEFEGGFTLVELFQYLWKNLLLILGIVVATVAVGVVYTWLIVTPKYTSTAEIVFTINRKKSTSGNFATKISEIKAELPSLVVILGSEEFITEALIDASEDEESGITFNDIQELEKLVKKVKGLITITNPKDQLLIKIQTTSVDSKLAYVVTKYVSELAAKEIDLNQYDDEETIIVAVENRLVTRAKLPTSPSSPNKILNVIISFLVGAIISVVVVLLKEQFSGVFKSSEEIEKLTGYPIIGEIFEQEYDDNGGEE